MTSRRILLSLLAGLVAAPLFGASPTPTPPPTPAAKKKLSGGRFGVPPGPTPTGTAAGDSLGDIARKAQESAPSASKPTRRIVITNESLGRPEPKPSGTSVTISGGSGGKPVVKAPPTPEPAPSDEPATMPEYRDASGRTEADWRGRAAAVRATVDSTEAALSEARAEARRLENDFYAWSDGNYREKVIRPAWDQARERVIALEDDLSKAKAAVADLEEEARKSGTPPGWLR